MAVCKLKASACSESLKYQHLLTLDSPSPLLYREDVIVYREVGTRVRSLNAKGGKVSLILLVRKSLIHKILGF
jgi:hypothetical protein